MDHSPGTGPRQAGAANERLRWRFTQKQFLQLPCLGKQLKAGPRSALWSLIELVGWRPYTTDSDAECAEATGMKLGTWKDRLSVLTNTLVEGRAHPFVEVVYVDGRRRLYPVNHLGLSTVPPELKHRIRPAKPPSKAAKPASVVPAPTMGDPRASLSLGERETENDPPKSPPERQRPDEIRELSDASTHCAGLVQSADTAGCAPRPTAIPPAASNSPRPTAGTSTASSSPAPSTPASIRRALVAATSPSTPRSSAPRPAAVPSTPAGSATATASPSEQSWAAQWRQIHEQMTQEAKQAKPAATPEPPRAPAAASSVEPLTDGQREFLASLTPEQRAAFDAMNGPRQAQMLQPHAITFDRCVGDFQRRTELKPLVEVAAPLPESFEELIVRLPHGDSRLVKLGAELLSRDFRDQKYFRGFLQVMHAVWNGGASAGEVLEAYRHAMRPGKRNRGAYFWSVCKDRTGLKTDDFRRLTESGRTGRERSRRR